MKKLDMKKKVDTVGGVGWKWKCNNTGWVSAWHFTYSGALKLATTHETKYSGHTTSVFPV